MTGIAKKLQNLRPPFTTQNAREKGRQGGLKSGESRKKKKLQRDILRQLLNKRLKDLPVDPEVLEKICQEYGLKTNVLASEAHCITTLIHALQGSSQYSRLLLEVDGSMDPAPFGEGDEGPETHYVTLLPARENYAKNAVERVKRYFTSEEWENIRVFFNSLVEARESKEIFEKFEREGIPDLPNSQEDDNRLL